MKLSIRWLEEYLGRDLDAEVLARQLTMSGLEVDSLERVTKSLEHVFVGCVRRVDPHPNTDQLKICEVDAGGKGSLQIVCGAANVREGMYVPVAGGRIGELNVQTAMIRGIKSEGMLCSAADLGIDDGSESLLDLGDAYAAGTDLVRCLWLDDTMVNLDLTPNRPDCLSVLGLAREIEAAEGKALPVYGAAEVAAQGNGSFPVKVSEPQACPRYSGCVFTDFDRTAKTPLWLRERLRRHDVQTHHPIVDVMNYVMLELGQPMHAFDLSALKGGIEVRFAGPGETIDLLDGRSGLAVRERTLLIADDLGAVALAGIMGGSRPAVNDDTGEVFIECAYFAPEAVIGKARTYGLHTESSRRFERGVDFRLQQRALHRVSELLLKLVGGRFSMPVEIVSEQHFPRRNPIRLRYRTLTRCLGIEVERKQVVRLLSGLGLDVRDDDGGWLCTPPSYRFDLEIEKDLIEEVGRLYGYDKIVGRAPVPLPFSRNKDAALCRRRLAQWSDRLVSLGYHQVITYSFSDPDRLEALGGSAFLGLTNPISPQLSAMRTLLWPDLLKALVHNLHHQQTRLRLFEVGRKFVIDRRKKTDLLQPQVLAGLVYGTDAPEQWGQMPRECDFYDVKNDLESLLTGWGDRIRYRACHDHPGLHPGSSSYIQLDDTVVGVFGALHPNLEEVFDVPKGVFLFEIDNDSISDAARVRYRPISPYPYTRRDISVTVPESVDAVQLRDAVTALKLEALSEVRVFDVYSGGNLGKGRKSIAFSLIFQSFSGTISDEESTRCVTAVLDELKLRFDAYTRN